MNEFETTVFAAVESADSVTVMRPAIRQVFVSGRTKAEKT